MCKTGDIILISHARDGKYEVGSHPFLVLDDTDGIIRGTYQYDFIALLMSSNTTQEKHDKLHRFSGNFPIAAEDKEIIAENYSNVDSFVKAEQLFYFDKTKVNYIQLGRLDSEIFGLVVDFMNELKADGVKFKQIVSNATAIND